MAPRHLPRRLRNLDTDAEPRACYNSYLRETLDMDSYGSYIEVPHYLVASKDMKKRAVILKSGTTGYGCPVGFAGTITYPLGDKEKALLISMGAGAAAAPAGTGVGLN